MEIRKLERVSSPVNNFGSPLFIGSHKVYFKLFKKLLFLELVFFHHLFPNLEWFY